MRRLKPTHGGDCGGGLTDFHFLTIRPIRANGWIETRIECVDAPLTGVMFTCNMTPMVKTQVYLGPEQLDALHQVAARLDRSVADLIREAIRRVWLRPTREGPVGLWNGEPRRTSVDHDSIYDNP